MEPMDLEEAGFGGAIVERKGQQKANKWAGGGGPCGTRCVVLRKYSLPICLIEALAIMFFVYLLVCTPPHRQQHGTTGQNKGQNADSHQSKAPSSQNLSTPRIFTFDQGGQSRTSGGGGFLLLDLIEGCDRRRHDLALGVVCKSSQAEQCAEVESNSEPVSSSKASEATTREAIIVATTKSGQRMSRQRATLRQVKCGSGQAAGSSCRFKTRLEVHANRASSGIIGWGGALTDSSINNILSLTTNGTRRLLDDYFGPDGLMFNMVRVTIGGSDFSARFYTNDDTAQDDFKLDKFKLREEDILYKIPLLKLIQREYGDRMWSGAGGLKLFASMWSPPTWMKTNNHFNKGQLRGAIDDEPIPIGLQPPAKRDELHYYALAELKCRFLQAYQAESIRFWGLTVMNEPLFAVQPFLNFNTMIFPRDDYANYVAKYLGPKIKNNPKLSHIKLMAHDDNRRYLANYTWPMLDQTRVRQFIDGVSVHGYVDEQYELIGQTYAKYREPHNFFANSQPDADFFVLPTELCSAHLPFMAKALVGNWHRGVHYGLDIIRSLQSDAAGWVDWNMALDTEGGPGWLGGRLDAPVIVDKAQDLYYKSPMFYVLGQFSRYIPPGSVRLAADLHNAHYDHHLETVTYALPKAQGAKVAQLATVILNSNPYPIGLHLRVLRADSAARARKRAESSSSKGSEQSAPYYLVECPADSIITVIYPSDL